MYLELHMWDECIAVAEARVIKPPTRLCRFFCPCQLGRAEEQAFSVMIQSKKKKKVYMCSGDYASGKITVVVAPTVEFYYGTGLRAAVIGYIT